MSRVRPCRSSSAPAIGLTTRPGNTRRERHDPRQLGRPVLLEREQDQGDRDHRLGDPGDPRREQDPPERRDLEQRPVGRLGVIRPARPACPAGATAIATGSSAGAWSGGAWSGGAWSVGASGIPRMLAVPAMARLEAMQPPPWVAPELVQLGRLPIHSVPHADRLELDGTWRFQLLPRPMPSPARPGARSSSRGPGRCRTPATCPSTRTSRCRSTGIPPDVPEANPTGLYERSFELPAAWAGRRVVLHVGAAESVLIVRLNGARRRHQQGFAPGRRVRRHGRPPARHEHADASGS